jgi:hypothetical protein
MILFKEYYFIIVYISKFIRLEKKVEFFATVETKNVSFVQELVRLIVFSVNMVNLTAYYVKMK